ncbi:hypothetical protein DFH08DRAFT_948198 [Mycena albidolilacea]|uniref:Uncharacterized protein n=1 Tax=Mycena albidolilacea TaxID=1033008 RepID=A0AAD7AQN7_9AGAR|nr:hypothetical protein DFH08DRAFT_948198 [Mycena albidolilacea]
MGTESARVQHACASVAVGLESGWGVPGHNAPPAPPNSDSTAHEGSMLDTELAEEIAHGYLLSTFEQGFQKEIQEISLTE